MIGKNKIALNSASLIDSVEKGLNERQTIMEPIKLISVRIRGDWFEFEMMNEKEYQRSVSKSKENPGDTQ